MSRASKPLAPSKPPSTKKKAESVSPPEEQLPLVAVFVYGSLKKNFQLHEHYLKDQQLKGPARIEGFTLISLGSYPGMIATGNLEHSVAGELYLVEQSSFDAMRSMEERAGYETVKVNGTFHVKNGIPSLTDSAFDAFAWVLPTDTGVSEWTLVEHQNKVYGYVAYTINDDKETKQ